MDDKMKKSDKLDFGDRIADKVAEFGGSWAGIGSCMAVITTWISINLFMSTPFDRYPFILLNLVLSCLAALQAPIIMMSQNRQSKRDRIRDDKEAKEVHHMLSLILHQGQEMDEVVKIIKEQNLDIDKVLLMIAEQNEDLQKQYNTLKTDMEFIKKALVKKQTRNNVVRRNNSTKK